MNDSTIRLRNELGSDVGAVSEIMHDTVSCKTRTEMLSVITRMQRICGFQSAILALVVDKGENRKFTGWINHSYPEDWLELYQRKGFSRIDPLVLTHGPGAGTRRWKDVYLRRDPPRKFLSASRDHGLRDGWTTGICNGLKGESSLMSFSWGDDAPEERQGALLHLLAPHLHQLLLRALFRREVASDVVLTPKEEDVLKWIKEGKSNWETASILGISERTVKFHVGNVLKKLNAVSRGHAVALALEKGL